MGESQGIKNLQYTFIGNEYMKKNGFLKAGIIGCGNIGKIHAECIQQIEGIKTTAYCDVYEQNAQKLLQQFGGVYATDDADALFNDISLDIIYVTTHNDTHAEYCIRALETGKHVLVEKPLALNVNECIRVCMSVKQTGKKLMTAFKMRYYDMLIKAKELIPNPILVTMQMMDDRWPDAIWANDPIQGGGNVISQGCHSTDILRFLAGSNPIDVFAAGGNYYQASGVIDNILAVYRFENGAAGNLIQGDCSCSPVVSKFFMQLFSENKSVTLDNRLTTLTYKETGKEPQIFHGTETGFLEENKAFVNCILEDTSPPIDHIDGLYSTLMVLQAMESVKSGKPEPVRALIDEVLR